MFIEKLTDDQIKSVILDIFEGTNIDSEKIDDDSFKVERTDKEIVVTMNEKATFFIHGDFFAFMITTGYLGSTGIDMLEKEFRHCVYNILGDDYKKAYIEREKQRLESEKKKISEEQNNKEKNDFDF
ncbi:MAG: hypothetical protein J5779_00195 [Clostridia bacterium]|nr:hypothetical protein [Clostridia bacterium]